MHTRDLDVRITAGQTSLPSDNLPAATLFADAGPYVLRVNWGDGITNFVGPGPGGAFTVSHQYAVDGSDTITTVANLPGGAIGVERLEAIFAVNARDPQLLVAGTNRDTAILGSAKGDTIEGNVGDDHLAGQRGADLVSGSRASAVPTSCRAARATTRSATSTPAAARAIGAATRSSAGPGTTPSSPTAGGTSCAAARGVARPSPSARRDSGSTGAWATT